MSEHINHRERKRRQQRAAATRRPFLLGGVATGGLGFAALASWNLFSDSGETDFAKFLGDLDRRSKGRNGSDLLMQKAPEIDERTTHEVERYIGSKIPQTRRKVLFLPKVEALLAASNEGNGCATSAPSRPRGATIHKEQPDHALILLDTDIPKPATVGAEVTIHEKIHLLSKNREFKYPEDLTPFLDPNLAYTGINGLRVMFYPPNEAVKNNCTIRGLRTSLLEANTQYSTLEILLNAGLKLGPQGYISEAYTDWTPVYTQGIAINQASHFF